MELCTLNWIECYVNSLSIKVLYINWKLIKETSLKWSWESGRGSCTIPHRSQAPQERYTQHLLHETNHPCSSAGERPSSPWTAFLQQAHFQNSPSPLPLLLHKVTLLSFVCGMSQWFCSSCMSRIAILCCYWINPIWMEISIRKQSTARKGEWKPPWRNDTQQRCEGNEGVRHEGVWGASRGIASAKAQRQTFLACSRGARHREQWERVGDEI